MFEKKQNIQESLEQILKEVDNNPSHFIKLSDAEIVAIVGGAYLKAVNTLLPNKMPNFTIGEENCGPDSCHPACNTWCHNWCNE